MEATFQSTHSLRSATKLICACYCRFNISIHALLAECDVLPCRALLQLSLFQSTHSLRSATLLVLMLRSYSINFNPRTPCGVRQVLPPDPEADKKFQSTHSLRSATGNLPQASQSKANFNPRTPCGVRRLVLYISAIISRFQSTHSLRSATFFHNGYCVALVISIHALLAECDSAYSQK